MAPHLVPCDGDGPRLVAPVAMLEHRAYDVLRPGRVRCSAARRGGVAGDPHVDARRLVPRQRLAEVQVPDALQRSRICHAADRRPPQVSLWHRRISQAARKKVPKHKQWLGSGAR